MFKKSSFSSFESIFSREELSVENKFIKLYLTGLKPSHIIFLFGINKQIAEEIFTRVKDQLPDDELDFVFCDASFEQKAREMIDEMLKETINGKLDVDHNVKLRLDPIPFYEDAISGLKMTISTIDPKNVRKQTMWKSMFQFTLALEQSPKFNATLIGIGFCYSILGYHSAAFEIFTFAKQLNKTLFDIELAITYDSIILNIKQPEDFLEVKDVEIVSEEFRKRVRDQHNKKVKENGNAQKLAPVHMPSSTFTPGLESNMKNSEVKIDLITKPAGITHSTLYGFHYQLNKLVQMAFCTKDNLTTEEKIDLLLKKVSLPFYLPSLLGLSEEEALAMVNKYTGKLSYNMNDALSKTHNLCFVEARIESQKLGSNYTTEFFINQGWQNFVNLDKSSVSSLQKSIFSTRVSFLKALLIEHKNIEAIVGAAISFLTKEPVHLNNVEWLAKAYKIDPYATVNLIYEKNLLNFVSGMIAEHVLNW